MITVSKISVIGKILKFSSLYDSVNINKRDRLRENIMKFVIAIIQPGLLEKVQEKLSELGVLGMTVTEVQGYGRQKGKTEVYRGAEYSTNFVPKTKIEVAIDDKILDAVIDAICDSAGTGKIGDGKIFVFDLQQSVRIRTKEMGSDAL